MTHCLSCFEQTYMTITWKNIFQPTSRERLCATCVASLQQITGNNCSVCSRRSETHICYDCERWQTYYDGEDPLRKNVSIYTYNDAMKELIARWKYRGDYVLGYVFQSAIQHYFSQYIQSLHQEMIAVPIPVSRARLLERGFNQAEMLAQFLPIKQTVGLKRQLSEKQVKKSRKERMMKENPFSLQKSLHIPVVLVDDIYTTGSTLRHAAQLLKEAGCPAIYALTVCRS